MSMAGEYFRFPEPGSDDFVEEFMNLLHHLHSQHDNTQRDNTEGDNTGQNYQKNLHDEFENTEN